jgi:hypothetical protein
MAAKKIKCYAPECDEMFDRPFMVRRHCEKHHPDLKIECGKEMGGHYYNGVEKRHTERRPEKKIKRRMPIDERCPEQLELQCSVKMVCNAAL